MGIFILNSIDLDPAGQFAGSVENDVIRVENFLEEYPYVIFGLSGNDSIESASDSDTLYGLEGNDTLSGFEGNDLFFGNQGNDWIEGDEGIDTIYGGQDDDLIYGGFENPYGQGGIDYLFGNLGNDTLIASSLGSTVENSVFGGQGNDLLKGTDEYNSKDIMSGDRGNDILLGGDGQDTFILNQTSDSSEIPNRNENADLIVDFIAGEDKIGLVGVSFEQLTVSNITSTEINKIFGSNALQKNVPGNIVNFVKIEAGGELLAVLAQDRNNFTLRPDDIVIF